MKRPQGLKSTMESKKPKTCDPTEISSQEDDTVMFQLEEQGPVDEYQELCMLHEHQMSFQGDQEDYESLLNGIIHECDRILRLDLIKEQPKRCEMYYIYATALYESANFKDSANENNRPIDFVNAAIERLNEEEVNSDMKCKHHLLMAKCLLLKAALESNDSLVQKAFDEFKLIRNAEARVEFLESVVDQADQFENPIEITEQALCEFSEISADFNFQKATAHLTLCNFYAEQIEQDQDFSSESFEKCAQEAVNLFKKSLETSDSIVGLKMLGEALIQLGVARELLGKEPVEYQEALEIFKKAHERDSTDESITEALERIKCIL